MRIYSQSTSRGKNKAQKNSEMTMWEKNHFISLGIIKEVEDNSAKVKLIPSFTYEDYDMKKGFTDIDTANMTVQCLRVEGLALSVDDVVVVVFTDLESIQTIIDIRNGRSKEDNFNASNNSFHNQNSGIIINKVII